MDQGSIAPCGVICDLCLGFQRNRNTCVRCGGEGYKPYHCTVCRITLCPEKQGNRTLLCHECHRFPCRRIRDLDKRYAARYGESPIGNLEDIRRIGMEAFLQREEAAWSCPVCGKLLCAHREVCLSCGSPNPRFPGA